MKSTCVSTSQKRRFDIVSALSIRCRLADGLQVRWQFVEWFVGRVVSFCRFCRWHAQALTHIFQELFQPAAEADRICLGMTRTAACLGELCQFLARTILNLLKVRRRSESLPLPHDAT